MTLGAMTWRGIETLLIATMCVVSTFAQATPKERFTVNLGFRDWGPTTIAGNTIIGGNSSNRGGKLNALDLETQKILWSYSRITAEPNWPFGFVSPVGDGLWVDSYQALVKLQ